MEIVGTPYSRVTAVWKVITDPKVAEDIPLSVDGWRQTMTSLSFASLAY